MKKEEEKKVIKKVSKSDIKLVSSKLIMCDDGEQRFEYIYSDKSIEYRAI